MLIEAVELTLAHVDLGHLTEVPLLKLFATAQAHHLTAGTDHTLHQVTDASGTVLYPGYVWLHLRVPAATPLSRYRVWDRVGVGVEIKRYGQLMLESTYVLGAPGEIDERAEAWDLERVPSMRSASMWVLDGHIGPPRPASPRAGTVAPLPPLPSGIAAIEAFRRIRATGGFGHALAAHTSRAPLSYLVEPGRDVAAGKNLMFATYVQVMEVAEAALLRQGLWPGLPVELLEHRQLLEREVFFLAHTAGGELRADVRVRLLPCAHDAHGPEREVVSAGRLEATYELYEAGSNTLLTCARATKLFVVPRARATLIDDLARFLEPSRAPLE